MFSIFSGLSPLLEQVRRQGVVRPDTGVQFRKHVHARIPLVVFSPAVTASSIPVFLRSGALPAHDVSKVSKTHKICSLFSEITSSIRVWVRRPRTHMHKNETLASRWVYHGDHLSIWGGNAEDGAKGLMSNLGHLHTFAGE